MASEIILDGAQIEQIIPHRKPFRFVDGVVKLEPGKLAVGILTTFPKPEYDWLLESHFPGNPVIPGAIMDEALRQTGAVAALSAPENAGKIAVVSVVKDTRYRHHIRPGDYVLLEAELIRPRPGSIFGRGHLQALFEDKIAVEENISFFIADTLKT